MSIPKFCYDYNNPPLAIRDVYSDMNSDNYITINQSNPKHFHDNEAQKKFFLNWKKNSKTEQDLIMEDNVKFSFSSNDINKQKYKQLAFIRDSQGCITCLSPKILDKKIKYFQDFFTGQSIKSPSSKIIESTLNKTDQQSNVNSTKSGRSSFIWKFLTKKQIQSNKENTKIYLVVKPKRIELNNLQEKSKSEDEFIHQDQIGYSVLPISNMERINGHGSSTMIWLRDLMFRHDGVGGIIISKSDTRPQDRGKRPFLVDHSISTNLSYEYDLPYQYIGTKPDDLGIYERQKFVDDLSSKIENQYRKEFFKNTNSSEEDFWILPDEEDEDFDETKYWVLEFLNQESPYSKDFEYNCADIDPNATFSTYHKFFSKTEKIAEKDIIPVFSSFEEAEKFLITALEDSLEPYKKQEIYTTSDSLNKTSTNNRFNIILDDRKIYNAQNIDYLDENTSFAFNNYPLNLPITNAERKVNKLAEERKIKTISNYKDHYNNYDKIRDLFGVNKKPTWFSTYMPSWIPRVQTNLLQTAAKTEIIQMDLNDFLQFWSANEEKMGEILYIPSSNKFKSFTSNKEAPLKKIYEYQKNFHGKSKRKNIKYSYKIKQK